MTDPAVGPVHPLSPSLHPPRRSASLNLSPFLYADPSLSRSTGSLSLSPSPSPSSSSPGVTPHAFPAQAASGPSGAIASKGYFDLAPNMPQPIATGTKSSGIGLGLASALDEDELMGSNSSRRHSGSGEAGTIKPRAGKAKGKGVERWDWARYMDSVSRDEVDVLEQRFDLMDEEELREFLQERDQERVGTRQAQRENGLGLVHEATVDAKTPRPALPRLSTRDSDNQNSRDQPLFPPSPPELAIVPTSPERTMRRPSSEAQAERQRRGSDSCATHPLSVLSRAVRELREVVVKLEMENAELRDRLGRRESAGGLEVDKGDKADQLSIHDGLTEALSTSLTSPKRGLLYNLDSGGRSASPAPTTASSSALTLSRMRSASRPKSPSSLSLPMDSGSREEGSSLGPWKASKSSWWGWSGGNAAAGGPTRRPPSRKMSGSSLATSTAVRPDDDLVEEGEEGEADEHWFRRGDGGNTPSFRAIFLATRILTPDPSSILVSTTQPASVAARLAHELVCNARDQGIVAHDPAELRRVRSRSRAASNASRRTDVKDRDGERDKDRERTQDKDKWTTSDSALAATVSMGRNLLSSVSNATIRGRHAINTLSEDFTSRPSLLTRASSSRPFPTTAVSRAAPSPAPSTSEGDPAVPVELSSIVPDEARPPTVLLSRQNLGSFFQSNRTPKMITATRFTADEPPLTDRYGFIYDIQHASMLKDASAAGALAPASLNGQIPEQPHGAGWIERRRRSLGAERPAGESSPESDSTVPLPRPVSTSSERAPSTTASIDTDKGAQRRKRGSTLLTLNPSPARPTSAKDDLIVSARGSSSLQSVSTSSPMSATLSHPSPSLPEATTPNASRVTVSSLLDQLTDMHDRQQAARTSEWDAFLRRRSASLGKGRGRDDLRWSSGLIGIAQMGRSKSGLDEYRQFLRLVRAGIPLAYRSDVWAECSGAKDSLIPGEYDEILAVHASDTCPFAADIEKDVSRTFPGNVFFGGDGPGVTKLRRVLTAYAWHNPAVGYCQGMNMLTATLLLTHTDEEQAYWTLLCMIERLLPKDFFSASLVGSRADQAVLNDLVAEHVPRVHAHLAKLGVDLASVTFGWFLSLFTDCLPVDTLFRVWDVFFVEGHDTLFRVALAIIKLNEGELCATDSVSSLFALIGGMTSRLWSADKLVALQHSFKTTVKHADVAVLYERHLNELLAAEE